MQFRLKFNKNEIKEVASRYAYTTANEEKLESWIPAIKSKGYLSLDELQAIAYWESPRSSGHVTKNSSEFVEEITAFAPRARDERSRI